MGFRVLALDGWTAFQAILCTAQPPELHCRSETWLADPKTWGICALPEIVVIGLMGCFHNVPSVRPSWTALQVELSGMDGSWMDSATGVIA